ncbi:MAG: hypothetical protein JXA22_07420 [Candidatus Thermoplasmatota archaeon]|nr:hypothetical protein [Candidatus Thermoplasmatota archaeon]
MMHAAMKGAYKRKKSEEQARLGAILVWSSIGVVFLSLMIIFSYAIMQAGDALTEEDFDHAGEDTWTADIKVDDLGLISGSINSMEDNFRIRVTVYDSRDNVMERYDQRTPVTISVQVFEAGTYTIEIEIRGSSESFEDLDISISSTGLDVLMACCGFLGFIIIFLCLFITGSILLIVSFFTRRGELRQERPPVLYGPPTYHHIVQGTTPDHSSSLDGQWHVDYHADEKDMTVQGRDEGVGPW